MKKIVLLLLFCSQFFYSQQPNGNNQKVLYSGVVVDQDTKEPISFATILIKEQGVYRFCQEDGSFKLSLMLNPESILIISAMGYKEQQLSLNQVKGNIALQPQIEELSEVVVTAEIRITPLEVMENVIKQKKNNYLTQPFNQKRYTKVTVAEQDAITLEFEVINDQYHPGYHKLFAASQNVEQVKWNIGNFDSSIYKSAWNITGEGRTDQVQYAAFLKKGKYKNFDYQFVSSSEHADNTVYIIDYRPRDFSWKYTQFDHSINSSNAQIQSYRGRIFVRKKDYAVLKVEEEWLANQKVTFDNNIGSVLKEPEESDLLWVISMQKDVYGVTDYKVSNKEVFEYKMEKDGLNYPSAYSKIQKIAFTDAYGERYNGAVSQNAKYLDVRVDNLTEYPFEAWDNPKEYSLLNRVDYNPEFWEKFFEENPKL